MRFRKLVNGAHQKSIVYQIIIIAFHCILISFKAFPYHISLDYVDQAYFHCNFICVYRLIVPPFIRYVRHIAKTTQHLFDNNN